MHADLLQPGPADQAEMQVLPICKAVIITFLTSVIQPFALHVSAVQVIWHS